MPTSPDTLLRRVKQAEDGPAPAPRFVGIDDWAWREGRRYGTIVVDLERSRVIDLPPGRDAETVKKWLKEQRGVKLISRDRWSDYAQAAAEAAPDAQQVADRWHLLKNLREAIERLLERQSGTIAQALRLFGYTWLAGSGKVSLILQPNSETNHVFSSSSRYCRSPSVLATVSEMVASESMFVNSLVF
jgi:hypothetical protein